MKADERGTVSVVLLGVSVVVVMLAGIVAQVGVVAAARHRAAGAADLAALASVRGGCGPAGAVAWENGARLVACTPRGDRSVVVTVRVGLAGPAGRLAAGVVVSARAGSSGDFTGTHG